MRSAFVAPLFAAAALVQSVAGRTSSYTYSNTMTAFTTLTDSRGVVTGMPSADASTPDQPALSTDVGTLPTLPTLPSGHTVVNSVPAGLPTGIQTVTVGNETITASIGKSTTVVLAGKSSTTSTSRSGAAGSGSSSGASATGGSGSASGSGSGSGSAASASGSGSGSASSSSSSGAAAATNIQMAGGALLGAAGFFAALL